MRIVLVALAAPLAAVSLVVSPAASVPGNAAGPPAIGSAQYVVRADPRLCPSPLCGGYWVTLANRARTRCGDGALRPRCYVARAVDEHRHPLSAGVPEGALARAAIEPWKFESIGELDVLVVADVRAPAGRATDAPIYRVRDTEIRCVRAPCFFMRAFRLSAGYRVTVSELGLGPARLTAEQLAQAEAALQTTNGLFVAGDIERAADGGRRLSARRVYLRP